MNSNRTASNAKPQAATAAPASSEPIQKPVGGGPGAPVVVSPAPLTMAVSAPVINETDWQEDEITSFSTRFGAVRKGPCSDFELKISSLLPKRRLYGFLWSKATGAGENWVKGKLLVKRDNAVIAELPIATGAPAAAASALQRSLACFLTSTNIGVSDCVNLLIAGVIGGEPQNAVIAPLCFYGIYDAIGFRIDEVVNTADFRIWVGCLSSLT